jgi:hypothetical protein
MWGTPSWNLSNHFRYNLCSSNLFIYWPHTVSRLSTIAKVVETVDMY